MPARGFDLDDPTAAHERTDNRARTGAWENDRQ